MGFNVTWSSMRDTLTLLLANNKGADQPAHPRSLISAFVIRYLKSKGTMSGISNSRFLFCRLQLAKYLATPLLVMSVAVEWDVLTSTAVVYLLLGCHIFRSNIHSGTQLSIIDNFSCL